MWRLHPDAQRIASEMHLTKNTPLKILLVIYMIGEAEEAPVQKGELENRAEPLASSPEAWVGNEALAGKPG